MDIIFSVVSTATTLSESHLDDMALAWRAKPTKVKLLILRLS